MKVVVETHGCRLNQADGDALARLVEQAGHEVVANVAEADAFVLNGCTITSGADADARRRVRTVRREAPHARVVLTGCFANAHGDGGLEGVDVVLGNVEKSEIAAALASTEGASGPGLRSVQSLVRRRGEGRPRILRPSSESGGDVDALPVAASSRRTRAYLKVQDGCNYQCSFCIVPQVRGRSRSVTIGVAQERLRELVAAGHPEIGLVGIHLGTWGWDLGQRRLGLAGLVRALVPILGRRARLRLGSIDPHEVDDALLDTISSGEAVCPHLHLPIQSADDRVLTRMRRAHRAADLERLVPRIRAIVPDTTVGTDLIVGFPGEDERAFERTMATFDLGLSYAHVFRFSERAGTAAARWKDRPATGVVSRRAAALRERSTRAWMETMERHVGRERDAILVRCRGRESLIALTDNFLRVRVDAPAHWRGRRVIVRIDGSADAPRGSETADSAAASTGRGGRGLARPEARGVIVGAPHPVEASP